MYSAVQRSRAEHQRLKKLAEADGEVANLEADDDAPDGLTIR